MTFYYFIRKLWFIQQARQKSSFKSIEYFEFYMPKKIQLKKTFILSILIHLQLY